MSVLTWIFVPKCAVCGKRLPHDIKRPLCNECLLRWEREKEADCPICGQKIESCWCGIKLDVKHNIYTERHLSNYSTRVDSATKRIVLGIKKKRNVLTFDMLSHELAEAINADALADDNTVITFVPRSSASILEYGFDQARELASGVSRIIGIPLVSVLVHSGETAQKSLDFNQRIKNAARTYSFSPDKKDLVKHKNVIIIDDIVTSGATAARCAQVIKRAGADRIVFVSIAKDY